MQTTQMTASPALRKAKHDKGDPYITCINRILVEMPLQPIPVSGYGHIFFLFFSMCTFMYEIKIYNNNNNNNK